ncbi:SHOCT-like domain-containing protein [Salinicoccus roseus]|uniref:SHOCT-like domain-containing protein n=1 Tax=Salinicoccus roseus TaxID=45670 RepID=UPI003D9FD663
MDNKDRILKMLEEGKITSEEAVRLLDAIESKPDREQTAQNEGSSQEHTRNTAEEDSKDVFQQFMSEFQRYVNTDKANQAFSQVKSRLEGQKQTAQVYKTFEKAFDNVKNSTIDSMFTQGSKNRLIETIEDSYSNISVDITNGNVKVVPTDRVTTAKFEVTPFYRKLDKQRNYFQDIICEVKNDELIIVSDIRTARVNVELQVNPSIVNRLIVSGSNGNVSIEGQEFNDLTVDLLNGSINLDETASSSAFIRTSRGNVNVKGGAHGALELISMVGTINTETLNAKDVTVSSNGSVNISLNERTESATINANMGSININVLHGRALEGRLSTVVGQINYPPDLDVRFMKSQDIGFKELMLVNDTDEKALLLEVGTKFGSVTLHRS